MLKEKNNNESLDCDCYDEDMGCTMLNVDQSCACPLKLVSILSKLTFECLFKQVFDDIEAETGESKRKIGYMRADYDGLRWRTTVFPCHNDICTAEIAKEIDYVYDRLTADNAFRTLTEMKNCCYAHKDCVASKDNQDEYNFYLEGECCLFWIRCITRPKDYNLYLHAFTKEQKGETQ